MSDVTLMLQDIQRGAQPDAGELLPLVYDELRKLAAARMMHESPGQTLQPTALVHEAWLRVKDDAAAWQNRAHFFSVAAEAMRRILIDRARAKACRKRGGDMVRVEIEDLNLPAAMADDEILLVNEALEQLEEEDPEEARVVVLKFFGGLSNQETADALGCNKRTVDRQWAAAKIWLYQIIREKL